MIREPNIELKKTQAGNALFLILIAVILFATLSFALTGSSRTGAGNADNESGQIYATQLNQYPALVRSQILRMRANKVEIEQLEFNLPSDFGSISNQKFSVFYPGSNAAYALSAPALMANAQQGRWFFNLNFEINNIGSNSPGNMQGNDLVAFLPGLKANICQRVNDLFNLSTIPSVNSGAYYTQSIDYMDHSYSLPASETVIGDTNLSELDAQPFGCFLETSNNVYIYYFTLIER